MCCKKDYCNILNFSGHGFRYSVNLVGGWGGVFSCNLYPLSFIAFHNFSLLMFCMKIQSFKVNLCSWFFSEGQVVHQSRIHFKKKRSYSPEYFCRNQARFSLKNNLYKIILLKLLSFIISIDEICIRFLCLVQADKIFFSFS